METKERRRGRVVFENPPPQAKPPAPGQGMVVGRAVGPKDDQPPRTTKGGRP